MKKSIFIFRRDLRLEDNSGLICALNNSDVVIPIFIFTGTQLNKNNYKSDKCVQFMMESLDYLDKMLRNKGSKLRYFYTPSNEANIIKKLIKLDGVEEVYVNMDYTPYSVERDRQIKQVCDENKVLFISVEDLLLHPVNTVAPASGTYYKKFTPYFNNAKKYPVNAPVRNTHNNYLSKSYKLEGTFKGSIHNFYKDTGIKFIGGGSNEGAKLLSKISNQKQYNSKRDDLTHVTTRLSAHNKFGTISIRHVYHTFYKVLGARNDLIKQLYWRDFFYNVAYNEPTILGLGGNRNFNKKYSKVKWLTYTTANSEQKRWFEAWCSGTTGYPVVDAAMRELNTTGFMHNRGRLIVASFLCKIIGWHWKDGEKYFATHLVDYDPCQNNGGWQWCSGSGVDAQPYFRIFNPWAQAEKYDKNCEYIKKWVPELKDVNCKHIHQWYKFHDKVESKYFSPIFEYEKQRDKAKKIYKFT